jgi:hypothetical protein
MFFAADGTLLLIFIDTEDVRNFYYNFRMFPLEFFFFISVAARSISVQDTINVNKKKPTIKCEDVTERIQKV